MGTGLPRTAAGASAGRTGVLDPVTPELVLIDPTLGLLCPTPRGAGSAPREDPLPAQLTPELVLVDPALRERACTTSAPSAADQAGESPRRRLRHPIELIEAFERSESGSGRRAWRVARVLCVGFSLSGLFLTGVLSAGAAEKVIALVTTTLGSNEQGESSEAPLDTTEARASTEQGQPPGTSTTPGPAASTGEQGSTTQAAPGTTRAETTTSG